MQLKSIQAMRAVAAMMVVFFHLSEGGFVSGAAGVDIFFVISGFIMGTVGVQERPSVFLRKRLVRIVPLYWLVTFVMCVGAVLGVFRNFSFDTVTLAKSLAFIPYLNPDGNIWPLVVVGWTLNFEMFFYLVFALGLMAAQPVLLPAIAMVALTVCGFLLHPAAAPLQVWTSPLLLEFTAGLLLSQARPFASRSGGIALILAGIGLFVATAKLGLYEAPWRVLGWGVPAFCVVTGALAIERAGAWPSRLLWPLEKLGDASYSLYLLHGIAIAAGHRFLGTSIAVNALIVLVSLVMAQLSFMLFEKPVGRLLNRVFSASSGRTPERQAG
ncbi:acyltransferase family protein [Rhizobium paknamense]|uniref:Exopolysaccharide production protein ExoZ n=1 Tax=Rhizobium paknamense TaxID=1206817 RepID=A0ABU0I957_9HYPH|nr:acyltransferase [Rhizobium paknamense]MDQ0454772.1 exopolysaccharide production protein ExoZ [Rhizobium paknamense]